MNTIQISCCRFFNIICFTLCSYSVFLLTAGVKFVRGRSTGKISRRKVYVSVRREKVTLVFCQGNAGNAFSKSPTTFVQFFDRINDLSSRVYMCGAGGGGAFVCTIIACVR